MQKEDILHRVRLYCEEKRLFPAAGTRLCAAVSGGADSMALLLLLLDLRRQFGFELTACHVNHGLRGAAADGDEAFVRDACARLGVPLRVFHASDVADAVGTRPTHAGEDWARRLRYACFAKILEQADMVATAHTANDQAETLLFRLARGTGLHGASGIRPVRDGYVRPLLCLTRQDTESYCRARSQCWVTDETNNSEAYARNRLRHAALPAMQSVNSAAVENLARFCEKAAGADAFLRTQADQLLSDAGGAVKAGLLPAGARYAMAAGQPVWALSVLASAHPLVRETALHGLVAPVRDAEEKYVQLLDALICRGSGAVQLTDAIRFCAGHGFLWQEQTPLQPEGPQLPEQLFVPENGMVYTLSNGCRLTVRVYEVGFEEKTQGVHKKDLKNRADYARITTLYQNAVLRSRRPGDRYHPDGQRHEKALRKWMNEAGIPPRMRDTLPLLAEDGHVLWAFGAGFAYGLAPDDKTRQILWMQLEELEENNI